MQLEQNLQQNTRHLARRLGTLVEQIRNWSQNMPNILANLESPRREALYDNYLKSGFALYHQLNIVMELAEGCKSLESFIDMEAIRQEIDKLGQRLKFVAQVGSDLSLYANLVTN